MVVYRTGNATYAVSASVRAPGGTAPGVVNTVGFIGGSFVPYSMYQRLSDEVTGSYFKTQFDQGELEELPLSALMMGYTDLTVSGHVPQPPLVETFSRLTAWTSNWTLHTGSLSYVDISPDGRGQLNDGPFHFQWTPQAPFSAPTTT